MNRWLNFVQQWIYPPTCLLCGDAGSDGRDLCLGCDRDLPRLGATCIQCASPLPDIQAGQHCGRCQHIPPYFDRARVLCHYAPPADRLLLDLKFNARLAHGRLMGQLLAMHLDQTAWPRPQILIPVPLHNARLRERGFNQAQELARPIATQLAIPIDTSSVHRTQSRPPQSSLPAKQRRANVRGCFSLHAPLSWQHVAIIDDVITTGHTVNELARVLRRAGAKTIEVWAWARTSAQ